MIWYENNNNDIIISTRIRLARNIDGVPFPNALTDKSPVTEKIKDAVFSGSSVLAKEFTCTSLDNMSATEKQAMAEEHLISFDMLSGDQKTVLISKDKTMSIMLMEEDHIRLQIIKSGYAIDEAFDIANKIDDVLEERLKFAFDENWGYLTACPTNTGTGMRASVMMHLPALSKTNTMPRLISSTQNLGIAIRGIYGEGSKAYGNMFQISNSITEGFSENEILEKLKNVVKQICELEEKARKTLSEQNPDELADSLYRSYGTLKFARSLSSQEAKALISDVLLGKNLGIIKENGSLSLINAMVLSEPALLCDGKQLSSSERDKKRAEFLRKTL